MANSDSYHLDVAESCWHHLSLGSISIHLIESAVFNQAAYAAPIIMMAQNRQNDKDRIQARKDYQTNVEAKQEIEQLQQRLNSIEVEKLDKIIQMLEELKK